MGKRTVSLILVLTILTAGVVGCTLVALFRPVLWPVASP